MRVVVVVEGSLDVVAVVERGGEVAVVFGFEPLCGQTRLDVDGFAI